MTICVLGSGVVGVSTAFALSRAGHEVIVIDKADRIAAGASHANGAQLSWSYTDPMASPAVLPKLTGILLGRDPAMRVGLGGSPGAALHLAKWGTQFLGQCRSNAFRKNKDARDGLAAESRAALDGFARDLPSNALQPTGVGKLVIAQTPRQLKEMRSQPNFLSAEECRDVEPALASWSAPQFGGLYSPDDSALDTLTYCTALSALAREQFGARFELGQEVSEIIIRSGQVQGVRTIDRVLQCDTVVSCLGMRSNALLRPHGLSLPLMAVRGYSVTLPATESAPRISVTDLFNKFVFANLGDRIRIAGFADIATSARCQKSRIDTLLQTARRVWPGIADYDAPPHGWTGARPMPPSGIPHIGETKVHGLYVNAGHGSLGYTFAAGSAMRIVDAIGAVQ